MMKRFNSNDSLGYIVGSFPGAGDFFMRRQIDFCCGGDRTLKAALDEKGISEDDILVQLNGLYAKFQEDTTLYVDWATGDRMSLIDHILNNHHQFLKSELPAIGILLFKILGVHGSHHSELFDVHRKFSLLRMELEEHLVKEEVWLFPAIKAYETDRSPEQLEYVRSIIATLEEEHVAAGDLLKSLREITGHYTVPSDGCTTFALTYAKLQELEKNTFEHVHLENNILFKHI
jgi:regulator of cell morphogenesis and NO signaling